MAEARKKQRLFVDIDGTLAVFTPVDTLETLYEQGYFLNLAPHENVVAAVKEIVANHPEIEVNILSAYLTDSQYALQEKNEWLDRYLPEIDQAHRVFVPCGSDKKEGISGGIRSDDFLLDDYTHNLNEWQPPARGIKLLNAINHTRGSWEHDRIRYDRTPTDLADGILSIMRDEKQIFDEKINESGGSQVRNALESRVTGDELLNAQDLIEELRAVGADIDEDGYVTVYHRTDHASEENIKSSHVMVAKEDGLFFSTVENGQNEGYGDSVVKLSIPVEKLVLDDIFSDEAHLRYPLENGIRQLDISDYLVEEREENMAQERPIGVKPAPTDLAEKIVNFMENYDPAFGYAEGVTGQENKEQWIDTTTESLLQESGDNYISYLRELSEQTPEAKEEADAIILEIMNYEGKLPNLNQMPVSEVATLDFVNNPDRQGTGGLNRDSRMFEAMLLHTMEQEQTELYRRYDEAFAAANLKDDFQPKIAILQLREGEENHNRRFTSLETLDRILHEQPNCENYELVYLRNAEAKAETEQERERLNNQLYAEFNANTLRPRDYYGHSLSVGDVIVMTNDFSEQHAYYVDDMGFTKLPDDFLSHEMSAKIRNDLDIRQEGALYETIGQFEAENTLSIMDKTATDRYFQITSEYSRIFELADRRGAIMDMDALGYEPAQVDGFSDDFLMWKPKNENEEENTFGFDGWDAVRDFTHDVQTLMNDYTVQQLRDRANGDYSVIEYGSFGDREVETAINNHPQDEYRRQVQAIYEYEFSTDKPTRSDVEDMHLNHISEIAIDRHEAEYGADGSRNFPNLNDPSPEEQAEELRQIVAEKSAPVEIDETLPPKDQLKQRLENGVRQVLDSEQFKNWLTTGGKLFYNNYSFRNAMLVWLQKPDASYVMGYEKWKDFGRNVKQGAQGAKIFIPLMASEKYKGGLFRSIKSNLTDQLSKDPSLTEASYRLGTSNLEFTMNRANHLIGFKVNGKEQQIFGSDDEAKRFIDRAIIGKVPTGFTVGTVFDAKDVIVPEYLWVKSGYTKEEIAPDEKGNPVKNRRGEVRIFNTPERQARFQTELDTRIVAKDPVKMQALFDACVAASERKGVPVSLAEKADDSTLDGGAKGYFSRQFTEDKPNGFIVIDNSLEITEKCAVLFHEMGHADLHKNLEALAKSMGEDKITREMREVQAEATAYAVASTFGIETDTSSFQYLAAYARGFELQDFQKSLDVIYRETQALTNDIKAELDIRGLNLDLTEKPKEMLNKETLETLSTKYMDFAAEQGSKVQAALNELPSLVKQSAGNPELMDVLKYQKANLDSRKADLDTMLTAIENLNTADTREKQDEIISTLDAAMNRVNGDAYAFENLSENYVVITERARGGLKVDFEQNPHKTLEAMKKDYPALAKLSEPQLQYLATSKFVAREFTKLLRDNPQEFVDKACERAALISKAASKNGTFVEVNFCEQWTDKPFFEKGTLCSPKIADKTVTGCEAQARGFSAEAEKRGDYFPYTKCDLTIFTPNKDGKLISLNTRVDIGDGAQTSLKDHLEQLCKRGSERKEVLANFTEALTERADKRKLLVQDLSAKPQSAEQPEMTTEKEGNMSREEWDGQIKDAREKAAQEQREKAAEKAQNKSNRDRAE